LTQELLKAQKAAAVAQKAKKKAAARAKAYVVGGRVLT
jgi:hypothetical protein